MGGAVSDHKYVSGFSPPCVCTASLRHALVRGMEGEREWFPLTFAKAFTEGDGSQLCVGGRCWTRRPRSVSMEIGSLGFRGRQVPDIRIGGTAESQPSDSRAKDWRSRHRNVWKDWASQGDKAKSKGVSGGSEGV